MVINKHLKTAKYLANLLDNKFEIAGFKFGLDPILDIIPAPFLGDLISYALSAYIVWIGYKLKVDKQTLIKMLINISTDFLIGLLPLAGWVVDAIYKANQKNIELIDSYLNRTSNIIEGEIVS